MRTFLFDEPGFATETTAFLKQLGPTPEISDYATLLAARAQVPDPDLSGHPDPAVQAADLYLPARGGPVHVRLYQMLSAAGSRPVLLWLHGGGFIGGSVPDIDHVCSH